jgi:hypothetical protein
MASDNLCARLPTMQAVWIHQIHAAGGASGCITMVVMCCVFILSLIICKKSTRI